LCTAQFAEASQPMSRHSRHSNDRSFFTHKERVDAGYAGTRKDVLGTDCFLPFGYCALSLKPPKDPVCTPDGWVYDRECILESLLNQKLELQVQAKKYEEQELKKSRKEQSDQKQLESKEVQDFMKGEQSLLADDHRHKRALEKRAAGGLDDSPAKKLRRGELLIVDKAEHRSSSFWAKNNTPTAAPTELKKVDTIAKCPMSGKKLRAKDLIPLKLQIADQKMHDGGGGRGVFCCAVSKNSITHQQAVVIKPSGVVVLESILADCVYKDMICPISGKKLKKGKDDVAKLHMGGTGFAAHNEVEAKSFSFIRSTQGDARTQQGHLPRAGYVGLH